MSLWPLTHLVEVLKVGRADRLFPAGVPSYDDESVLAARKVGLANGQPTRNEFALRALAIALAQIGCGETANNCGPDVERYVAPAKTPANWCAGFVGWCYEQAARELSMPLPFRRSLGAKKLGRNVGALGRIFVHPGETRPGDLMVFHRGAKGSWMGHVAMVEDGSKDGTILTVEGNAGPRVMRRLRFIDRDRDRFAFFASLRR